MTQNGDVENRASVSESGDCHSSACGCNRDGIEEAAFWEEFNALLIQMVCLVERRKMHRTYTTSDLRAAGKRVLCK